MSTAKEIKRLIKLFLDTHHEYDYAEHMSFNENLPKKEMDMWMDEAYQIEYVLYDIANQINKLQPSKYIMKKYFNDLNYILSWV